MERITLREKWAAEQTTISYCKNNIEYVPHITKAKFFREDVKPEWTITYYYIYISNQSEDISETIPRHTCLYEPLTYNIPDDCNNIMMQYQFSSGSGDAHGIKYRYC